MDINKVLEEYDSMFGIKTLDEIDEYLEEKIEGATIEKDVSSLLTLLNEHMGFCRDTYKKEKGLLRCEQTLKLLNAMGLAGSIEYATSLINVANAYRAFGKFDKALKLFSEVEDIYQQRLTSKEYNFASLYNNWSLLYQEMGDFKEAVNMLEKALVIIDAIPEAKIAQAVTRSNLATSLFRISNDAEYDKGMAYLKEALQIFIEDGERDFHYSIALSAMGDALYFKEKYREAAEYYERALSEIEKHVGKTENYERVYENYQSAKARISNQEKGKGDIKTDFCNNMERSKSFYERYGADMIHRYFPEYEDRIAVGLVGEGSDCFEFDDEISMDHDYGVGFLMWLSDEDYEKIGRDLQERYEKTIIDHGDEFVPSKNKPVDNFLSGRRGVFKIYDFYENILNIKLHRREEDDQAYVSEKSYLIAEEALLATATNGQVFRDNLGMFTDIRNELKAYYPEKIRYMKLAEALHDFSQYAQSNYARMMARHDYVTANLCVAKGVESAMQIMYLVNKEYAPYYKWMYQGLCRIPGMEEPLKLIREISDTDLPKEAWEEYVYNPYEINHADKIVSLFEKLAYSLLEMLKETGVVTGENTFLERYVSDLIAKANEAESKMESKDMDENNIDYIEEIIQHEWKQFDKVENEGGRADCQDNYSTFYIMRKSQYLTWSKVLLKSFLKDLTDAEKNGWNLITEKYARMMESTAPAKYLELKDKLPVRSEERIRIQEEIIRIQVEWMEEFANKYPKFAGTGRSIHTKEDNEFNTSSETYLRGELSTYSEETFILYGRFIVELKQKGENLTYNTMDNMAKLYGYASVEDAESKLQP